MSVEDSSDDEKNASESDYVAFEGRQIRAVLFKLLPMTDALKAKITTYVHGGLLQKDLLFALEYLYLLFAVEHCSHIVQDDAVDRWRPASS
jgi:hypothetical protein